MPKRNSNDRVRITQKGLDVLASRSPVPDGRRRRHRGYRLTAKALRLLRDLDKFRGVVKFWRDEEGGR